MKTPITAIDLICKNHPTEEILQIQKELQEIERFVEQALYYARSEVVEKDYFIKEISLSEIVYPVILEYRTMLLEHRVQIVADDLELCVYTDEKWIQFILKQLLSNAVKYARKDNAKIHIYSQVVDGKKYLTVEDNGIGIAQSDIGRVCGSKSYITKAVDHISFEVQKGEFLGIMGASGSGKSTLLNCISTIDRVTSGHIYLEDTDITELKDKKMAVFRQENLGFVFQDFNLLDTLTLEENIALAPMISGVDEKAVKQQVRGIAERLDIGDVLKKVPYQVSGGQKQRCACARALINKPKLLLADEPTGALDSRSASMLLESFALVNRTMKTTILMVTHDIFSASYCSRILFLRDGKLFNELYKGERTRKEFFHEIMDVMTFLGGDLTDVR